MELAVKKCSKCKEDKSISEFSKDNLQKDGIEKRCKNCHRIKNKLYREKNKDLMNEKNREYFRNQSIEEKQIKSSKYREYNLKRNFNISISEYNTILLHQNNVCFICGNTPKTRKLSVDHDHKTGLLRALLCAHCNLAVGKFHDKVERLQKAIELLTNPPATQALGSARYGLKGRVSNKASTRKRLNK